MPLGESTRLLNPTLEYIIINVSIDYCNVKRCHLKNNAIMPLEKKLQLKNDITEK